MVATSLMPGSSQAPLSWRERGYRQFLLLGDANRGACDSVELRVVALEVGVTFLEERILLAPADAAAGRLGVLGVPLVGVLHTLDDAREGYERLAVVRLGVVAQVD